MTAIPDPDFTHLSRMTDGRGTFEHARFREPRPEHGYCTDDMARVLVVASREPRPDAAVRRLAEIALRFLQDAQGFDGGYRNRMDRDGRWEDDPSVEDCWGRSIWGLGTAAARRGDDRMRRSATVELDRAVLRRSPFARATAFATLGAAELLVVRPEHRATRDFVADAADAMPLSGTDTGWPWPEARLTYANAVLPEAMIAAGAVLRRPALQHRGLELLAWLLERETAGGHLSVTPAQGAGPADGRPAFDQQPIEVAALADACARASTVDGDPRWAGGVAAAAAWFVGENDAGRAVYDAETGGGFDGLHRDDVNRNEGTESTLALLSTLQQARHLVAVPA